MNLVSVAARNVLRNKFRTSLTIVGGAVAILAFVLLRTVLYAWNVGVEYAAKDRLATRHKVSFVIPLPKKYIDDVRTNVKGVKFASYANWFGAKWPKDPNEFFANLAIEDDYLDAYPEMIVPPEQMARWKEDKKGAIIGDMLANKLGVKVGDKLTLTGSIYPGDWEFMIDAIYTVPKQASVDRATFMFHWNYMNDSLPAARKDMIGWIVTRIDDPSRSAQISADIDKLFDEKDTQTATMSERAMNNSFMATISALLTALDVVSIIILLIMMMILGNTIAMGVRERTTEYGVLRALGFMPKHIRVFIVGEAVTTAFIAGILGLVLSYPIVELGMGKWLEENMGAFFPFFRIDRMTMLAALGLSLLLGGVAALIPAIQASRITVTDALRRIV
jgi:putative ABC transport system permease protein